MSIASKSVVSLAAWLLTASACLGQAAPEKWNITYWPHLGGELRKTYGKTVEHMDAGESAQAKQWLVQCTKAMQAHLARFEQEVAKLESQLKEKPDDAGVKRHLDGARRGVIKCKATLPYLWFMQQWVEGGGTEMPDEAKLAAWQKALANAIAVEEDRDLVLISTCAHIMSADHLLRSIDERMPAHVRARLGGVALGIGRKTAKTLEENSVLFERVLLNTWDTEQASEFLKAYCITLDSMGHADHANSALDVYLGLFYDAPLGATAARLRLASLTTLEQQDRFLDDLFERYAGSVAAMDVLRVYLTTLAERGAFNQALQLLDANSSTNLADAKTEKQLAYAIQALAESIGTLNAAEIKHRRPYESTSPEARTPANPSAFALQCAEHMLAQSKPAVAAHLALAAAPTDGDVAVVDLLSGTAVTSADQLGDLSSPEQVTSIAEYLLFAARRAVADASEPVEVPADVEAASASVLPYWHAIIAEQALDRGRLEEALKHVRLARQAMPISVPLAELHGRVLAAQQVADARSQIEQRRAELLAAADGGKPEPAAYLEAARLYTATREIEQAIGVLQLLVNNYPDDPAAPRALNQCIDLLVKSRQDAYDAIVGPAHLTANDRRAVAERFDHRIKNAQDQLLRQYSQSTEAQALRQSLTSRES